MYDIVYNVVYDIVQYVVIFKLGRCGPASESRFKFFRAPAGGRLGRVPDMNNCPVASGSGQCAYHESPSCSSPGVAQ